jgi:5-formyltetrahydrofolate cyclo-ligase
MTSDIVTKSEWRQHMKAVRRTASLPGNRVDQLLTHLDSLSSWRASNVIASYRAIKDELDVTSIDLYALESGKNIVYPAVVGSGLMEFRVWSSGEPLNEGQLGLHEPVEGAKVVTVEQIDFFLIPLLACDARGCRLGYGGGYYDRALAGARGFRCGVGYDDQYVQTLPAEEHDQRLDAFLSVRGIIKFHR